MELDTDGHFEQLYGKQKREISQIYNNIMNVRYSSFFSFE